jgi:hypothetical protein
MHSRDATIVKQKPTWFALFARSDFAAKSVVLCIQMAQ